MEVKEYVYNPPKSILEKIKLVSKNNVKFI